MKNVKPKGDHKPLTWEVNKETKDFGPAAFRRMAYLAGTIKRLTVSG
jgi:hypothetical protein